jgi:hypothetical protein
MTIGASFTRIVKDLSMSDSKRLKLLSDAAFDVYDRDVRSSLEVDATFESLVKSFFKYFPSFGLYLTYMGPGLHGFPAENDLHHIVFATFVKHLAGRGHTYQSKLILNGSLVTPVGTSLP